MKTKIILSILVLGMIVSAFSQNTLELTFTAIDSEAYVQLESIKIMNRTQGGDTLLYYPDTILILDYQVGISETNTTPDGFQVFQNYPNPIIGQTTISFYIPERDNVSLVATDMSGHTLIKAERFLDQGYHSFRFTPGNGSLFLFTVQWRESSGSIKILQTNSVSNKSIALEYIGNEDSSPQLKSTVDIQSFLFNLGDTLLYIGNFDTLQSGMLDTPQTSDIYTFQFTTNIPCPGTPTVEYEGHVYNTIQIFSQCWLKENLNVGTMIPVTEYMTDNDTIEKYCFNNNLDTCAYGGLYSWNEVMNYNTSQGIQGICPPGWHIPTDEEWKVLEGSVDSYYGIGDSEWDNMNYLGRGIDAGTNLKTTSGWYENGNGIDLFSFSGQPGGFWTAQGPYIGNVSVHGTWWSSSQWLSIGEFFPLFRQLAYGYQGVARGTPTYNSDGYSVRCLKDY